MSHMTALSAGTPDVDYTRVDQILGVTLADSAVGQRCFTFSVVNDSAVEEPMECLVIRLELPQNASEMLRIAPGNESTLCCILDDDSESATLINTLCSSDLNVYYLNSLPSLSPSPPSFLPFLPLYLCYLSPITLPLYKNKQRC